VRGVLPAAEGLWDRLDAPTGGRSAAAWAVSLGVAVALGACAGEAANAADEREGAGGWQTQRSTAGGAEIVRTVGAGDARATLTEDLRIGAFDGAEHETLARVFAVRPQEDGAFALVDGQALRIHYYAPAGSHVRSVGARGQGPGEFEGVSGVAPLPGGGLAVYDPRNRRVSLFSAGGDFQRSVRVPSTLSSTALNLLYPAHDGFLIRVNVRDPGPRAGDPFQVAAVRFRMDSEGQGDTLLIPILATDPTYHLSAEGQGRTLDSRVPFTAWPAWAWHPDGFWVAGTGAEYRLFFLDERGDTVRIFERETPAARVLAEEAAERRQMTEANMRDVQPDWRWSGRGVPERKAYFRGLMVDGDGRVWVQRHTEAERRESPPGGPAPTTAGGSGAARSGAPAAADPFPFPAAARMAQAVWVEPVVYDVFARDGRFLGSVRPPPGFDFLAAAGRHVWSRETSALGVPQVARYRIDFPTGAP